MPLSDKELDINPVLFAVLLTSFTWLSTALGAAVVYFTTTVPHYVLEFLYGISAGVMLAASIFSLVVPSLELGQASMFGERFAFVPCVVGIVIGVVGFRIMECLIPEGAEHGHSHQGLDRGRSFELVSTGSVASGSDGHDFDNDLRDGLRDNPFAGVDASTSNTQTSMSLGLRRAILLVVAITLHNFPEGMAVGVALGGATTGATTAGAAVVLALGLGIQNIPEGMAVSIALKREGISLHKSFFYGQLSGAVEPIGAIMGGVGVLYVKALLPYALGFAAGAMLLVCVEHLIPESQKGKYQQLSTSGFFAGFILMTVLEVALEAD